MLVEVPAVRGLSESLEGQSLRVSESHQVSVQGPEEACSSRAWRSRQCQRQCQPAFELWLWLSAAQGAPLVNAMLLMPNGGSIFLKVLNTAAGRVQGR